MIAEIARALSSLSVQRVVLHGYRTPNHTHHWIMLAMHRALEAVAREHPFELHWVDHRQTVTRDLVDGALVIGNCNTDGVHWGLPLSGRAHYIIHNHNPRKLSGAQFAPLVQAGRCMFFEVFRGRNQDESYQALPNEPFHFRSLPAANLVMIWATDLLPDEIEENMCAVRDRPERSDSNAVRFIGSIWRVNQEQIREVIEYCITHGLHFEHYGKYVAKDFERVRHPRVSFQASPVDPAENARLVREALMAPAIQGRGQLMNSDELGNYIPCRVIKNISYGNYGITNNYSAHELFGGRLIYHREVPALLKLAHEYATQDPDTDLLVELMDDVRRNHTYLNRIHTLLCCLRDRIDFVGGPSRVSPGGAARLWWSTSAGAVRGRLRHSRRRE